MWCIVSGMQHNLYFLADEQTVRLCNGSLFSQRLIYSTGCQPVSRVRPALMSLIPQLHEEQTLSHCSTATYYKDRGNELCTERKLCRSEVKHISSAADISPCKLFHIVTLA